jgi:hypothetical protein
LWWTDYGARWQDPQLGRFTTIDRFAEKYYALSNYGYGAANPIKYIDVNGDSLKIGSITNVETLSALQEIAQTKEGYAYLQQFAAKGDVIGDVVFEKEGKYSKDGFNLIYEEIDMKGSEKEAHMLQEDESKDLKVQLSDKFRYEFNKAETILHETFMHAEMTVRDYYDDGKFNDSNISPKAKWLADNQSDHYQHKQSRINEDLKGFDNTLFPGTAYRVLLEVNKSIGTNYNAQEVKSRLLDYVGR